MQVAKIIHDKKSELVLCVTRAGDGFVGIHNPAHADGTDSYFSISGDTTPRRYKVFCCCRSCLRYQLDLKRILPVIEREIPSLGIYLQQMDPHLESGSILADLAGAVALLALPLAINFWGKRNGVAGNILTPHIDDSIDPPLNKHFSKKARLDSHPFFSEESGVLEITTAPTGKAA